MQFADWWVGVDDKSSGEIFSFQRFCINSFAVSLVCLGEKWYSRFIDAIWWLFQSVVVNVSRCRC
ncbi:hypothetical protein ACVPSA_18070 [Salmonella enterica subsp. enterica serovar Enteritidis]